MGFNRNTWTRDYTGSAGLKTLARQDHVHWLARQQRASIDRRVKARKKKGKK